MINTYKHSRPRDPAERPGFRVRDVIRFFMVDIILIFGVKLLLALGLFPGPDSYVIALLASKIVLFAYLVWLIRDRRGAWSETGAATGGRWWGWLCGLTIYAACLPLANGIDMVNGEILSRTYAWLGRVYIPQLQDVVVLIFDNILASPAKITLVFFTILAGPFMEELAFRGMGLDAYRRTSGIFWAVVWTSLLFGMYHFSMQYLLPLSFLGGIFAFVRLVSGSLWCSVLVHCLHNTLALALTARSLGMIDFPWF